MGLARKLKVLLAIPITFTIFCIFVHLSRQAISTNLIKRGDGEESNMVNRSEYNGSNSMQGMKDKTPSFSDQKLVERNSQNIGKIYRRQTSTTRSTVPIKERITKSITVAATTTKTVKSNTRSNTLPYNTAVATSKPLRYTAIRKANETGWTFTIVKQNVEAIPTFRSLLTKSALKTQNRFYISNEGLKNQMGEFNVVEDMGSTLKSQILMDIGCNKSNNQNAWNSMQSNEEDHICKPYYRLVDHCKMSKRYYPTVNAKCRGVCRETSKDRICNKLEVSRKGKEQVIKINCTMDVCKGRPVTVASIDHEYGVVKKYKHYHNIESLEQSVQKAVSKSIRHGFNFVFLSCSKTINKTNSMKVEQILLVPPILETIDNERRRNRKENTVGNTASGTSPPNINVLVLDSISRAHFQRVFPDTADVLKEINKNSRRGSTVLDFPLFQSLAPFTFVNVKSFLTGKQGYKSIKNRDIGFNKLFEKLKMADYQTTAQEDTCWYDKWGSILTSNSKRDTQIRTLHEKKEEWRKFNQITNNYKINSLGLSHISCFILKKYGRTNMFNEGPSFCYDGKPLSSHLIDYATALHTSQESSLGTKPQFTYTHINIGHETTGKRACVADRHLSSMIRRLAKLNNTVTILWSDHGAKTTRYSIETLSGKFETYDAFLFMLFPDALLKELGEKLTKVIAKNQKAIVSSVDLHATVIALSDLRSLPNGNQARDLGLISDKTWRRGCQDLPVRDYSLCKCVNNYRLLDLNDNKTFFNVLWMAEFVTGTLNDKLNKQLSKNIEDIFNRNCQWLQGTKVRDALYDKQSSRYIFDVIIHTRKRQAFNVQVKEHGDSLSLFHWQRTSVYQDFDSCKDSGVSLELCICNKKTEDKKHLVPFDLQRVIYTSMFGAENTVNIVFKNDHCLALIERNHENEVVAFSVANFCELNYLLRVTTYWNYSDWRVSHLLPINITAIAKSITFTTSARKIKPNAKQLKLIITKIN